MTRFLSRDLPQHKHTASAKSSEPPRARLYSITTPCAPPSHHVCVCVCIAFGTLLQPPAFPPSRALSLSLCFILLSFRESFCFIPYFIFFLLHLYFCNKKKKLYSVRTVAAVKNLRKNTSLPTTISYSQRGQRTTTPHLGEVLCEGTAPTNQPHSL